jgi:hypothetical protein
MPLLGGGFNAASLYVLSLSLSSKLTASHLQPTDAATSDRLDFVGH